MAERSGVSLGSLKRFEQTGQIAYASLLQLAHVLGRLDDFDPLLRPLEDPDRINRLFDGEIPLT